MKAINTFNTLSRKAGFRFTQLISLSFCIFLLMLAFTTGDSKSEYMLPLRASSVCAVDLDLDGDNDIIVGHKYSSLTSWGGLSILENEGQGDLFLVDSFYVDNGFPFINTEKFDNNDFPDIFSIHVSANPYTVYAGVIYNYAETQFDSIKSFFINYDEMVDYLTSGDVNGDGYKDIVFACNTDKFWGILYNLGTGNFSEPEYYNTEYWPNDLAVGDIDGNGRDDIALCGTDTEIYYSFETGFEYYLLSGIEHDIELDDMDNDGDLDVITVWGAFVTTYIIYENLGYQNFQQNIIFSFNGASGGLLTPDLNNDSLPDITFMDGAKFYILNNEGNLEFTEPDTISLVNFSSSTNYCWGDLDNNSFPDIIVFKDMGIYAHNLKVLFNDGYGNFEEDPITGVNVPYDNPQTLKLVCFPNPYINEITIEFHSEEKSFAEISIYDLSGKRIKKLIHHNIEGGITKIKWDGLDNGGNQCKPGTYLLSLKVNGNVLQTIKLIKH